MKKLPNGNFLDFDKMSATQILPNGNLLVVVENQSLYFNGFEKEYILRHLNGDTFEKLDEEYKVCRSMNGIR